MSMCDAARPAGDRPAPVGSGVKQRMRISESRYTVGSVRKALLMLEALGAAGPEGMTVTDLARQLHIAKSTAFACLQTLAAHDFVGDVRDGENRRYRLGMALARRGEATVSNISLTEVGLPILRTLMDRTELTARLAVLKDGHAVVVASVQARGTVRLATYPGHRELLHCSAIGKALLAMLRPDEARAILRDVGLVRRTERTIVDRRLLQRELAAVRERGYAVDDEEDTRGVVCVGAAALDRRGEAACALSVTEVRSTDDEKPVAWLGEVVRTHADRLAASLGALPTPNGSPRTRDGPLWSQRPGPSAVGARMRPAAAE